jgi:transposase-like protein
MAEALEVLVGPQAKGLSASTVSRLKQEWGVEYQQWRTRSLSQDTWVYVWADGIYSGLRGEDAKLCALVIIGVNERGRKELLAIEDGQRESTQSWREVLLDLKSRGMKTPKLAVGDGAMGFWAAIDEVFPEVKHQRCWMHKTGNILNKVPKSVQPKMKEALHDIWRAETKENAEAAFDLFIDKFEAKYPKATLNLQKDRDELLAFYDFPAKHWQSIRTTNPIESVFGTIRHRTKRSKGCLNRDGMLHMIFKLGLCAQNKWRRLRGFDYLAKVITGVQFKDGIEVTESNQDAA